VTALRATARWVIKEGTPVATTTEVPIQAPLDIRIVEQAEGAVGRVVVVSRALTSRPDVAQLLRDVADEVDGQSEATGEGLAPTPQRRRHTTGS
jgi:hypothetical protein